jgi:general secretion pathway protein I
MPSPDQQGFKSSAGVRAVDGFESSVGVPAVDGFTSPVGVPAVNGFTSPVGVPAVNGFTLIEMLVALAIFSLAALALLRLGGATATNSARLHEQAIAQIVARNLAVEAITDPEPPAFGMAAGEAVNAGRRWRWTRSSMRSPEARIQQIEINVAPAAGGPGRARLIVFRRAPL